MLEKFSGLCPETPPNGEVRHRVRPADGSKKITLLVGPDHPIFHEHYHAARAGVQLALTEAKGDTAKRGTVGWLVETYCTALNQMVEAQLIQATTVHARKFHLQWLRSEVGEYPVAMPTSELMVLRDKKMLMPGASDNFLKAVRAMYEWAMPPRGIVTVNPATGSKCINLPGGAIPCTVADLLKFRERHPPGTTTYLALSLFMFTACRLGYAIQIGRRHEITEDGIVYIAFQPEKRGSAFVKIPMMPALFDATRAVKVVCKTAYLPNDASAPFSSKIRSGTAFGIG